MTINDLVAGQLQQNLGMLQATIADFSDNDMLVRPAPGANHAMWQLGHLVVSEVNLINLATPGAMPELPAGFAQKFSADKAKVDDPKAFPTKGEVLEQASKVRQASVQWAKKLTSQDMDQPCPDRIKGFAPTIGDLAAVIPSHVAMHVGQMQVVRRKLGKPILF